MPEDEKSLAERWFEEQQAWQKTMRDYADAMVKDEQFLMHMGNAMRGSLLAGVPYPDQASAGYEAEPASDALAEILFTLKRIEGRLRDLEASVEAIGEARAPEPAAERAPAKPRPAPARKTPAAASAKPRPRAPWTSTGK